MQKSDDSVASGKRSTRVHDRFFRSVFQGADYITSLIRVGAPDILFDIIDWSTLRGEPSSILAPRQPEKLADLVFSVNVKDSGEPAKVVLLFEHKSYRDAGLIRQLAENQFRMYLQNEFRSLIIPIVVLQGAAGSLCRVEFIDLFSNLSEGHRRILTQYSVNFRCLLINVNEIDRQGLARRTNIDAVVRAMPQVRGAGPSLLRELVDRMKYVRPREQARMLGLLIGYVSDYNTDITLQDMLELQVDTSEEQQMILSAAEVLREEGREEVREEVAANLLQNGMDLETVVEVTQLSRDKVQKLRSESDNSSKR